MIKSCATVLLALGIPLMLSGGVWQSFRYSRLETEIRNMEKEQYSVIQDNNRMISGITVLSTPERIERVAVQDLSMRKARPEEIMRIELEGGHVGG